ncbi:MAG: transcriptional regulator [Microbacterium sp.]
MSHPRHDLDPAFQTPLRLSLMAALGRRKEIDFGTLRDVMEADDSSLSKAISFLDAAGYVKTIKGYVGKRPRTWVTASARGHRAFVRHVAALRAIVGGGEQAGGGGGFTPPPPPTEGRGVHPPPGDAGAPGR